MCMSFVSTVLTYIALNALDPCPVSTVLTYIILMVWLKRPSVSAFQNFLRIENQLNIKKVMGRNVWMCFVLTVST